MAFLGEGGDLEAYWRTVAKITELIGSGTAARIYWDQARQKAAAPYILVTEATGGQSHMHLAGLSGVRNTILHVYAYGDTPSVARTLAERVRLSLQGQRRYIGATFLNRCEGGEIDSGSDPVETGSDIKRWWRRVILDMSHSEPTSIADV